MLNHSISFNVMDCLKTKELAVKRPEDFMSWLPDVQY